MLPSLADLGVSCVDRAANSSEFRPPRLDPVLPGDGHSLLRIGDCIALCVQRGDRLFFMGSEGFVELGSSLREIDLSKTVPWTHVDCLWMVATKHQYDAQKSLRKANKAKQRSAAQEAEKKSGPSGAGALSGVTEALMASRSARALEQQRKARKAHEALEAAVTAERLSNAARNEEKRGTPLTYGETIQLRHVRSNKFLVFNPKRRSQSLGCYSVRLDSEGSEDAWIAVGPRHSFQFEGASVHNHDLLQLHSVKRRLWLHVGPSESVSSAASKGGDGQRPASALGPELNERDEVNAATTATPLQLVILRGSPSAAKGGAGGDSDGGGGGGGSESNDGGETRIRCGDIIAFYHCDEGRHLVANWEPHAQQDDVHFLESNGGQASPNALWMVQSPVGLHLSDSVRQEEGYCLQHLASGNYLTVTNAANTRFASPPAPAEKKGEGEGDEGDERAEGGGVASYGKEMLSSGVSVATTLMNVTKDVAVAVDKATVDGMVGDTLKGGAGLVTGAAQGAVGLVSGALGGKRAGAGQPGTSPGDYDANGGVSRTSNLVLCAKALGDRPPDLFEFHSSHSTAKGLRASSLVRMRHVVSGGWVTAIGYQRNHDASPSSYKVSRANSVMGVIRPDCFIRDGLLIERPHAVISTFLAVAGVTKHLLMHARDLEDTTLHGMEERPFTNACLTYLTNFIRMKDDDPAAAARLARVSVSYLQDVMRELGVVAALITLLTIPFERLGTVAFHKIGFDKPLLPQSKIAATLLHRCIEDNALNCMAVYPHIPALEPAARKSIGIGQVLQEVFAEVPVETSQIDFWLDLLGKARRGGEGAGADFSGGSMILSLIHAFCFRRAQPVTSNQNLIMLKLILSPSSDCLDDVQVLTPGHLAKMPPPEHVAQPITSPPPSSGKGRRTSLRRATSEVKGGFGDESAPAAAASRTGGVRSPGLLRMSGSPPSEPAMAPMPAAVVAPTVLIEMAAAASARAAATAKAAVATVEAATEATVEAATEATATAAAATVAAAMDVVAMAHEAAAEPPVPATSSTSIAASPADAVKLLRDKMKGESLAPLRHMSSTQVQDAPVQPEAMVGDVLQQPANLCVVQRRVPERQDAPLARAGRGSGAAKVVTGPVLCLSPFDKAGGRWIPLARLNEDQAMLDFVLRELELLGGLCCGNNGLTLHTMRVLYPFKLCYEIIADSTLPNELRAAACVLTRQLYIETPARRQPPTEQSVWDWDALLTGQEASGTPPNAACLSMPPQVVTGSPIGSAADSQGRRRASAPKEDADDDVPECALDAREMLRLQRFVAEYILQHSIQNMQHKVDLTLLGGVLDLCLQLFRHGHLLQDQGLLQEIFERLVAALGVPLVKPQPMADAGVLNDFNLALDAKALICKVLEGILEYRLRMRVGGVLRSVVIATTAKEDDSQNASPDKSKDKKAGPAANGSEKRWSSFTGTGDTTPAYAPLVDDDSIAVTPVPTPKDAKAEQMQVATAKVLQALTYERDNFASADQWPTSQEELEVMAAKAAAKAAAQAKSRRRDVNIFDELNRGAEILAWQRTSEDMIRALVRASAEARGTKPELLADALRVLFTQFNQARLLSTAVASVVVVKSGRSTVLVDDGPHVTPMRSSAGAAVANDNGHGAMLQPQPPVEPPARVLVTERSQAMQIGQTVRKLERVVMGLKALASTDPLPSADTVLDNLAAAVRRLRQLCTTQHQRKLQCALGAHESVVNAIRVLHLLEEGEGQSEALIVDGVYRLPPTELLSAREEAFDFLAAFCGGGAIGALAGGVNPRGELSEKYSSASEDEEPPTEAQPGRARRDSFASRRDIFGGGMDDVLEGDAAAAAGVTQAPPPARPDTADDLPLAENQEAIFPYFELIIDHMARVRKATTCAQRVLDMNANNCGQFNDSHLDQIISLMVEGSARYSWYMDVLLSLARGLPDVASTVPLKIMRKLLDAPNGYLLVLYAGTTGREKRARELASVGDVEKAADTGMVAFHHALVQLLAELCSGLANEVEMYVQTIVPLHETCAHICDAFCPYAIRASFFVLLLEGYTVTALKVQSLVQSPAVWQVLAIFVSELRSLLECIAGHGDEEDGEQAVLAIRSSKRGPSFLESGLWFCVAFLQKHVQAEYLRDDHKAALANLHRLCSRLLNIEKARNRAAIAADRGFNRKMVEQVKSFIASQSSSPKKGSTPTKGGTPGSGKKPFSKAALSGLGRAFRRGGDDEKSEVEQQVIKNAVEADMAHAGNRRHLSLGPQQLTLLSAVVGTLNEKGIGAGPSVWGNLGMRLGLASASRAPVKTAVKIPVKTSIPTSPGSPRSPKHELLEFTDDANADGEGGEPGEWMQIYDYDGGADVASKIAATVEAARPKLEAWEAQEFHRAVLIFNDDEDAIRPIIDQLQGASAETSEVSATIQERCLRVLQALLTAQPSLQDRLNDMGVTSVMLKTLASPSTPSTLEAALELGIALCDGGNRHVQETIYKELSSSGSNAALASLAHALNRDCNKIQLHFMEQKQLSWYAGVLEAHVAEAVAPRPSRGEDRTLRKKSNIVARGSSAALARAVVEAQEQKDFEGSLRAGEEARVLPKKAVASVDTRLANLVLLLMESMTEGHYAEMQDFLRAQPAMRTQVNVVIDLVNNLLVLERTLSSQTISLTCQLYQTLTELVQGPCAANQSFLIGTNLCDVAVRFMHGTYPDCATADVIELKLLCLKLLLAMVEGVSAARAVIPRRIASSLDYQRIVHELDAAYRNSGGEATPFSEMSELQKAWRELGFYFFLLIRTLGKYTPTILEVTKAKAHSYRFFAANTGAIEIEGQDKMLDEVYFPVPNLFQWLSQKSKDDLLQDVDRSTPQKRIEDFVQRSEGLIQEMRHNEKVSTIPPFYFLARNSDRLSWTTFYISVFMNCLILKYTYPADDDGWDAEAYWDLQFRPYYIKPIVYFLGVLQVTLVVLSLLEHAISKMPLTLSAMWEERGVHVEVTELWPFEIAIEDEGGGEGDDDGDAGSDAKGADADTDDGTSPEQRRAAAAARRRERRLRWRVALCSLPLLLMTDTTLQYYLFFYIPSCMIGLLVTPYMFSITLLDMVAKSRLLQKVIEAVTVNHQALTLTFLLVGVVTYHFTIFGQLFYRHDFLFSFGDDPYNKTTVDLCQSTMDCLMTTFYIGMSFQGFATGLADIREYWTTDPEAAMLRWNVDLLFYVIVIVMLLNIIFGIVIDTFAQNRDAANEIKDNMENVCFICGIDRNTFDRKHAHGYEYHIEHEHSVWHYLSFVIHINQKKPTERTGPESYVADMLEKADLSFYPILKAGSIVFEDQVSNESLLMRIEEVGQMTTHAVAQSQEALQRIEVEQKLAAERAAGFL